MVMLDEKVAQALLTIGAVGFRPAQPITFKSGILSPVYVDNRRLIFHPQQWRVVIEAMRQHIETDGLTFDAIAGIETAGIPHSSALAYSLSKPSVFVRKQAKEHGTRSRIEGGEVSGLRVLLIEDLVTTGGSSLAGVEALREVGAIVQDCFAITSYGLAMSEESFKIMGVHLHTLTPFSTIVRTAFQMGIFSRDAMDVIEDWLVDPHGWGERHNFERD
jgi:orotate phosphoribosyltransferase